MFGGRLHDSRLGFGVSGSGSWTYRLSRRGLEDCTVGIREFEELEVKQGLGSRVYREPNPLFCHPSCHSDEWEMVCGKALKVFLRPRVLLPHVAFPRAIIEHKTPEVAFEESP